MAGGRKDVLDIREIIRLLRLGQGVREIARDLQVHRKTIRQYRRLAREQGWLQAAELPALGAIQSAVDAQLGEPRRGPESVLEPHRAQVLQLRAQGVEMMAILQILREHHGFAGSYSSLRRFLRRAAPPVPPAWVRIEVPPGEEAQVDFGYAGKIYDPLQRRERRAWVFVMVLSHSRHLYAELVWEQSVGVWIGCHVRAFEFFGGVPRKVVVDNLKAAITKACFHEPEVQRSYRELAEHYGFSIAPCRPRTPRHKGKVEKGGVHYVKRNALAGRTFRHLEEGNEHLLHWAIHVAGRRTHGTTQVRPLECFEQAERPALTALPPTRYEVVVYKQAKVHPDCHVVFGKAYYSAPHRLVGQELLLRATPTRLELYHQHERVASHPIAPRPGFRSTDPLHYPPEKLAGALSTPVRLREQAAELGESIHRLVQQMLEERPLDRLRGAQGVLNLARRYGAPRVEAACRRALAFEQASYRTVATILRNGLDRQPLPPEVAEAGPVPERAAFARPVHDIAAQLRRKRWS